MKVIQRIPTRTSRPIEERTCSFATDQTNCKQTSKHGLTQEAYDFLTNHMPLETRVVFSRVVCMFHIWKLTAMLEPNDFEELWHDQVEDMLF